MEKNENQVDQSMTLLQLFRLYIDSYASLHCKCWKNFERTYKLYLTPWNDRPVDSIKKIDVMQLQATLAREKSRGASIKTVEILSMIYAKGIEWELIDYNPAKVRNLKYASRERFLLPDEITRFTAAVRTLRNARTRDYLFMLLFTGQRRRNVAEMKWEEIDLNRRCWRIPHTKNGTPHLLPLVPEAFVILNRRFNEVDKHPEFVFPKENGSGALWNVGNAWKNVLKRAELTDLRMHDLRRTLASWQVGTGSNLPVVGHMLNHKHPSSTAIYARLHLDPLRQSMEKAVDALNTASDGLIGEDDCEHKKIPTPDYGFKSDDGALVSDEKEQKVLQLIRDLCSAGHANSAIAKVLNENACKTRWGDQWTYATVNLVTKQLGIAPRHAPIPSYGWRYANGKLVPNESEQLVLTQMKELRAAGHTYRSIARILNERGLTTRTGKNWKSERVGGFLNTMPDLNSPEDKADLNSPEDKAASS
ncbi:MAG TPA: tyrosine-type recombinase/integrase [Planktothrix sp.]|jgi:integrase